MDQIILNKIALYFGLQYKPSSGLSGKNMWKENRYNKNLNKNT